MSDKQSVFVICFLTIAWLAVLLLGSGTAVLLVGAVLAALITWWVVYIILKSVRNQ